MPSYLDLPQTGSNISGDTTFEFFNPSASSYLVLETITTSSIYDEILLKILKEYLTHYLFQILYHPHTK
jgi:hypothetical protein